MDQPDVVENFHGVYLLRSLNHDLKGRTYIGYTVDPNRRIKQHNRGRHFGGARRTSKKGPWEMVLIVHGFPSDIAALRFEWAWQHPQRSIRLRKIVSRKKASESKLSFALRIMFTMLRTSPWNRLPLTLRWLSADIVETPPSLQPPVHMPIVHGSVASKKLKSFKTQPTSAPETEEEKKEEKDGESNLLFCHLCHDFLSKHSSLVCLNDRCRALWHVICLAKHFLENERLHGGAATQQKNLLPVEGFCPDCSASFLWGDLVRKKKGCYSCLKQSDEEEDVCESFDR